MELERPVLLAQALPKPLVMAIDGRSAAGKTTLAEALSQCLDAPVVHMDDFYLPFSARTPQRLAQPGGNFDLERFLDEVYGPLSRSEAFSYGVFDCSVGGIPARRHIPRADITIVEGAYSMHPQLRRLYSLRIFCDIRPEEQLRRLSLRETPEAFETFVQRWIPLEELYLREFGTYDACDLVLTAE